MKICFATNNEHKIREISAVVGSQIQIMTLKELSVFDELPETQTTLEGNAIQKARYVFDKLGLPCFADDSGLEVDALNGQPGVYSARFAGPQRNDNDNIDLLLSKLHEQKNRLARFRTVIAFIDANEQRLFEGSVEGEITLERTGENGFGYDPVFKPKGYNKTFAEMPLEEKNALSHRSQAVKKFANYLKTKSL